MKVITDIFSTSLLEWSASFRWPVDPSSACGSKETMTIGKTHLTLYETENLVVKLATVFLQYRDIV